MGILFSDIYTKSIALFDDPKITSAYKTNSIQFNKLMYTFLQNAFSTFNNPSVIGVRLSNYKEPVGTMEIFEGDGKNNTFTLDKNFEILDNSQYSYIEGELNCKGVFDKINRTVSFADVLPVGQQYAFEQYYVGEFLDGFEGISLTNPNATNSIIAQIKDILARKLVKAWAEGERNVLLDIRNIMQDSDFKLMGNDRILKSKNQWIVELEDEINQYQNKLAWNIRYFGGSSNIGRG